MKRLSAFVFFVMGTCLIAQPPIVFDPDNVKALIAKDDKDEKDEKKESPRMQKLRTATYTRKPSAILKAWSKSDAPDPNKEEKKDDKKDAKETKAPDPVDLEIAALQRMVTLGDWPAVKKY